jgi:magnesium chelatase family protein
MHTVRVLGACLAGTGAEIVTVEARFDRREKERTEVVITGLPDPVLRESRGRMVCALEASGLHVPHGRLFLNLVPAAKRKSGEVLDLPIALGAAAACGHMDHRALENALFLGEVGIDGALHAVPGGLSVAIAAVASGVRRLFAPPATAREAAWIEGIEVYGARHIEDVIGHLCGAQPGLERLQCPDADSDEALLANPAARESLDDVRGQYAGKLALAVAAAGGHGLLYIGPPGAGKSLLARRLGSLAGVPDRRERLEITRILSAAGQWPGGLATERPFRAPHHTISYAGLVGGGSPPQPGEITLAHCGVLFLDELPEFRREALEALRQPMESGTVLISRATQRIELPAGFQLVAAMNPCACGYQGHATIPCRCPPSHVARYRGRISGPLLDRFDLRVELTAPTLDELGLHPRALPTDDMTDAVLKQRVERARKRQHARQGVQRNTQLSADQLDLAVPLDAKLRPLLDRVVKSRSLSARAVQSIRRVARTLADLDDVERVGPEHLARAIALRSPLV